MDMLDVSFELARLLTLLNSITFFMSGLMHPTSESGSDCVSLIAHGNWVIQCTGSSREKSEVTRGDSKVGWRMK